MSPAEIESASGICNKSLCTGTRCTAPIRGLKTVIDVYGGQFGSRVSIFSSKNDLFGTVLLHAQKQDIKYKPESFCQSQQERAMMY